MVSRSGFCGWGIIGFGGLEGLGFNSGLRIRVLPVGVAGSGFRVPSGSAMGFYGWCLRFRVQGFFIARIPRPFPDSPPEFTVLAVGPSFDKWFPPRAHASNAWLWGE